MSVQQCFVYAKLIVAVGAAMLSLRKTNCCFVSNNAAQNYQDVTFRQQVFVWVFPMAKCRLTNNQTTEKSSFGTSIAIHKFLGHAQERHSCETMVMRL